MYTKVAPYRIFDDRRGDAQFPGVGGYGSVECCYKSTEIRVDYFDTLFSPIGYIFISGRWRHQIKCGPLRVSEVDPENETVG